MSYDCTEYFNKPLRPRYEFVYKILGDFIDESIDYPIDLNNLCQKNNWKLITYTFFDSKPMSVSSDGFSFVHNSEIYIFYNQMQMSERINFTIAHEIGHIVLGHHLTNDVLSHNGLIKNDAMEKEANAFARNLLSPAPLIVDLKLLPSSEIFARSLNVSKKFMNIRYQYLNMDYKSIKFNNNVMKKFEHYANKINRIWDEIL